MKYNIIKEKIYKNILENFCLKRYSVKVCVEHIQKAISLKKKPIKEIDRKDKKNIQK